MTSAGVLSVVVTSSHLGNLLNIIVSRGAFYNVTKSLYAQNYENVLQNIAIGRAVC